VAAYLAAVSRAKAMEKGEDIEEKRDGSFQSGVRSQGPQKPSFASSDDFCFHIEEGVVWWDVQDK